eukprot:COSAG01_NODE_43525_length_429_cov_0.493939_1_plen_89_part_10
MYRFEQDEGRRTKFTTARLNLASHVQYHYQLQYCIGTSTMIYRYSVPTVPIYLQAVCGRYQEGVWLTENAPRPTHAHGRWLNSWPQRPC